jgi:hypothetical protein
MNRKSALQRIVFILVLLASMGGLISCIPTPGEEVALADPEPRAWIDFPRDGVSVPVGASVEVVSHAYAEDGVVEVLLSVNGTAYRRDPPAASGDTLVEVRQEWTPTEPGLYTLEVRAYDGAGEVSGSDAITVRVPGEVTPTEAGGPTEVPVATIVPTDDPGPTATPLFTLVPTEVPTLVPTEVPTLVPTEVPTLVPTEVPTDIPAPTGTPPPPPQVNFWVDDDTITAGECTTLHWEVSWTTYLEVNGTEVAGTGTWEVCPASTSTYDIHAEGPGGVVDQSLVVTVSEPVDTTPPPVPAPAVPADELVIDCTVQQTLAWLPVEDPSGVIYYVKLEQQIKAGEWSSAAGYGPVSGKQVEADVSCGGIYRWAVRAEDGAGNISAWSEWYTFSVNLE